MFGCRTLTFALLAMGDVTPAQAWFDGLRDVVDPPERVQVVLDLSSSMASAASEEQPDTTRLAYVQRELGGFLRALPGRTHVGIRVFGTDGCGASSVLHPIGPLDDEARESLLREVQLLRPAGATPLARALRDVAESAGPEPLNVILLTDGGESCESAEAVCAAASALAARPGGPVRVDLVRLFLGPNERAALACVPATTGGRIIDLDQPLSGGLRSRLLRFAPLRAGVALLVILCGLATFVGVCSSFAAALTRWIRSGVASLLADVTFVAVATAWVAFWARPLLALPWFFRGVLTIVGGAYAIWLVVRRLMNVRVARGATPSRAALPGNDPLELP